MTTKAQYLRQQRMRLNLTADDWFNLVSEAADELDKMSKEISDLHAKVAESFRKGIAYGQAK